MSVNADIAELLGAPDFGPTDWSKVFKRLTAITNPDELERQVAATEALVRDWTDDKRPTRLSGFHFLEQYELSPILRLSRRLLIYRCPEERGVWVFQNLARCPHARELAALEIRSCDLYLHTISRFCEKAELPGLRELVIKSTFLAPDEPARIRRSPLAAQLERLEIR